MTRSSSLALVVRWPPAPAKKPRVVAGAVPLVHVSNAKVSPIKMNLPLLTLMVTVPAAIVVAAVYEHVSGGAAAVFAAADAADPRNLSVLRPDAAAGFGIIRHNSPVRQVVTRSRPGGRR